MHSQADALKTSNDTGTLYQQMLASIVQSSEDAIASKTLDGIVTSWNPGAEKLFGYTSEEMIGKPITLIIPPDRLSEEPILLDRIRRGERVLPFDTVRLHKSGRLVDISLSLSPIRDLDGAIIGVSKIARDITIQKRLHYDLEQSESRLNIALEAAEMGAYVLNFKTSEATYTKRYLQILGFPENSRPTHKELLEQIYPEDLARRNAAIEEAKRTGSIDLEIRIIRRDGSLRWIRARGKVFADEEGVPEKMMGTILDVTEQKAAFEEVQASERRLTKLADAMPQLVWIAEPDGKVTYYNNRLSEYGSTSQEATDIWEWQPLVHPDDVDETLEAWYNAISTRQPYSKEHRMLMKDGSYRWHLSRGFPDKDAEGNILKWFGTATDIDDIKKIQQSLAESEERLRFTLDAAAMGNWSVDLATGRAITSERHREIMGYEETGNLTREKYLKYMLPEDKVQLDAQFEKGIKEGSYQFEGRVQRPGKPISWIKVQAKTIYNEQGQPTTVLGTIVDITDEKHAARAILESEERFRIIANTAPVMIWMSGNDRFADFFNTRWLNFTGRTLGEERNEGWQENVHPDDLEHCTTVYRESYVAQRPFTVEYRLRRIDGVYRWILDNAVPRYSHDGEFIGFVSACMDIDDEKKFNEKLQANELMFKTITNVSPVGLWMTDAEGTNNYINDTWLNWTGISLNESPVYGWMEPVMAEERDSIHQQFLASLALRQKYSAEFRFLHKDGQVRWGLAEGFPYYDDSGYFGGYAGSVTDITERKQTELLKNDFLAVASHELKTPLTSIKAYAQLLSQTYEKANDAFLKNGLMKMENQVNKMTKLVADFLNLSKLESEKFRLDLELFDINELVREIAIDIQMVAINHTILLERKRPVFVTADREKISQVVTNLLINAVKYSPEDKNINVSLKEADGWVTVSIADKGIGIKAGEHEKIFQRFYRSEFNNNISFSGFGIGLYISAEIIKRHNGKIGVISEEGKGADFYFQLPVVS